LPNRIQRRLGIDLGDEMSRYLILNEQGLAVEEGSFPIPFHSS
jgi:hypothetical protein